MGDVTAPGWAAGVFDRGWRVGRGGWRWGSRRCCGKGSCGRSSHVYNVLRLGDTDIEAVIFAVKAIDFDFCQILRRQQFCQCLNKYNIVLIWFLSHFIPFSRRLGA